MKRLTRYPFAPARGAQGTKAFSLAHAFLLSLLLAVPSVLQAALPTGDGRYDDLDGMPMGWGREASPKREARAVWLTTLGGLDWPKAKANTAEGRERQQRELCDLLDRLSAIHVNTILFQTRIRGSVAYPSSIEPWDVALTGQYGKDPGYDPLQFVIDEAHKRGMELHAWVVTIPAYKIAQAKQMGNQGLHVKQARLMKKHGDQYYMDPGQPGTADYLADICMEIVNRYDVDGLHFDYIRYPESSGAFPDADTFKKYGNGKSKADWRRENITRIVRTIYNRVKARKPWVRISSSPVGKARDLKRFSAKGWSCMAVSQDAQRWLREGIHDALYPMMYFKGNNFFPFAADWQEQSCGRLIAPGLGTYCLAPEEKNWPLSDFTNQLCYLRSLGLGGQCHFRAKFLLDDVKGLYGRLRSTFYATPSLTPAATWLDNIPPTSPTNVHSEDLGNGMARLVWDAATDNTPAAGLRYNVYASPVEPVDASRAENLVAVALPTTSYTYNAAWAKRQGIHFLVTAMDRFGNESVVETPPSQPVFSPDGVGDTLHLPDRQAEFFLLVDLKGRHVRTGKYTSVLNLQGLPMGWYQVRTLDKGGRSRRVREFWKKR